MKNMIKILMINTLLLISGIANAGMIDFKALADGAYGESGFENIWIIDGVQIEAFYGGDNAFSYLDSGDAGLGVCKELKDGYTAGNTSPGSNVNQCLAASDDNVTSGEMLKFTFTDAVDFSFIINDNHGNGLELNDFIMAGTGGADNQMFILANADTQGFNLGSGTTFYVGFGLGQFYIESIYWEDDVPPARIPEPSSLAILGLGLVGLVLSRKKMIK